MTKRKSSGGVLIVVELGAEWPALAEARGPCAARRVLAQAEGESPLGFGARVATQLDGLFARGVPLVTAIMACNERLDDAAQRARVELARTAMGAMAKQRSGSLILSASDRNGGRSRHALSSLAFELAGEWQRASVTATVRFGAEEPAPQSSHMAAPVTARSPRRVA